jgi:hypothetical protein
LLPDLLVHALRQDYGIPVSRETPAEEQDADMDFAVPADAAVRRASLGAGADPHQQRRTVRMGPGTRARLKAELLLYDYARLRWGFLGA